MHTITAAGISAANKLSNLKSYRNLLIAATIVAIVMLIDNAGELYSDLTTLSIGYMFFNTSVFPAGLCNRYLSPIVIILLCSKAYENHMASQKRITSLFSLGLLYIRIVLLGGICIIISRSFFFGVLATKFPFVSSADRMIHLDLWPYYDLSFNGKTWLHITYILIYGFLLGCLYGGITCLLHSMTRSIGIITVSPFIIRVAWIQLCRLVTVADCFRIDGWLAMKTTVYSYNATLFLTTFTIAIIILICFLFLYHRMRKECLFC